MSAWSCSEIALLARKGEDVNTTGICPSTIGQKDQQPAALLPRNRSCSCPNQPNVAWTNEPFKVEYVAGQPYFGATLTCTHQKDNTIGNSLPGISWRNRLVKPRALLKSVSALAKLPRCVFYGTLEGYPESIIPNQVVNLECKTASAIIVTLYLQTRQQTVYLYPSV